MGKKLTKKISQETHALSNAAVEPSDVPATDDSPSFVIDTQGNVDSRRNLKRRQRDAEESALTSAALTGLAHHTARAKRRDSDRRMRKRPRTAVAASSASAKNGDELIDVWGTSPLPTPSPIIPRTHRKLAGQFSAHAAVGVIPSVEATKAALPDPGQSFHPSLDDHTELLTRVTNHHAYIFQQNEAVRRQLNPDLFPTATPTPSSPTSTPLSDDEDDLDGVFRPPTIDRRLTQTQRNRRRASRLKAALHSEAAGKAALDRQLKRLPVILSSLKKQQKVQRRRQEIIARLKLTQPDRTPRLGPYSQGREEDVAEVTLPNELSGSAREVRVSVNVVKDAMKRMEDRRLIEVRKRVKNNRRYSMKLYERYKESKEEGILPQYPRKGD